MSHRIRRVFATLTPNICTCTLASKSLECHSTFPALTDHEKLKGWEFPVDNTFAEKVVAQVGSQALSPRSSTPAQLCERCIGLNFWAGGFAFEDHVHALQERAKVCDFCKMLHDVCGKGDAPRGRKVRFERMQSTVMMVGSNPLPVLSIFRSPGKWELHTVRRRLWYAM